ncbi:MAG: endolytic transglycosylase MltG [Clostridiales bacterium]|nr:endolytic transglycosylase MltG [Clostridiales bacterium]
MNFETNRRGLRTNNTEKKSNFDILFLIWSIVRPIVIVITCIMLVVAIAYAGADYVLNSYLLPANPEDDTPIQVVINSGASWNSIAETLEAYDLIKNSTVFKYYVDFSGYGNKRHPGRYIFNKKMSMEEIMVKISKGDGKSIVTKFTIVEGSTIEDMANKLVKDGIITSTGKFLSLAKDGKEFLSYSFIAALDDEQAVNHKYLMEGYMFPDTYEIYVGSSEEAIMKKMLNKFDSVMGEKFMSRAEELGFSIDEIITLASIIEKEAKPNDFAKVSAVFHNRIEKNMALESCVTVQYVLGIRRLTLTATDIDVESPYNTYKYSGIPIGPICAPSQKAIEAALYPNEEFIEDEYLFFTTKDPTAGELEFNISYDDHEKAVEKYRPLWEAYDASSGN